MMRHSATVPCWHWSMSCRSSPRARAVVFLASDDTRWMNGEILVVSGGL
jgi:NAD(P)-dependent dehydrogenase (short-subunit alcohol dehydrogenase family)